MEEEEKGQKKERKLRWSISENTTAYTGSLDQPAVAWKRDIRQHVTVIDLAHQLVDPQILQVVGAPHKQNIK
jgi:hypothetical protein